MGLLDRLRGIKDPVPGSYRLVACSYASGGAVYENCTMDGVVEGPGIQPTSVHHVSLVTPVAKWPQPGSVLPVTVDRADPTRMKIRWDDVPTSAQLARAMAEQQAQQARSAAPAPAPAADPYNVTGGAAVPSGAAVLPPGLPPETSAMLADLIARARASGGTVTTSVQSSVIGADGRPVPGTAGGGLTPAETAQALAGGAAGLGLVATTARVLAAHPVPMPADPAPGGTWDLTLDVDGGAAGGWTSVLRIGFSSVQRRETVAASGRTLPVLADPVRHDRIAVDTSRPI